VAWGRHLASGRVLGDIGDASDAGAGRVDVVEVVRLRFESWHDAAKRRLDETAELFPEFVRSMQERLAGRLAALAEREALEEQVESGRVPEGVAAPVLAALARRVRQLRGGEARELHADPAELLRKVPLFAEFPSEEFAAVARRLEQHTVPAGTAIVEQGARGDAMFLIARGVVRVSVEQGGVDRDLATLMAGDFFGEMALLTGEPRTATCRSVTPCALYRLEREAFLEVRAAHPSIESALEAIERARREQLAHR
jgi:CPA1 family monovalent cation:H+ antiporter